MLPEDQKIDFAPIEIPRVRRNPWGYVKIVAAAAAMGGAAWAWNSGYRPPLLFGEAMPVLELYQIDQGDIDVVVVENGTIESGVTTPVRCRVEALLGTTASQGANGKSAGGTGGGSAQGSGGASGAQGGGSGGSGQGGAATTKSSSKTAAKKKAGSSGASAGSAGSGGASGGASGASSASSSTASSSSGSSAGASSGAATTTTGKPVIRSFSYQVTRHVPLRPVVPKVADNAATKKQGMGGQGGMGGGGGGGGGGRGGGRGGRGGGGAGGMGGPEEKPGATRIVDILPEGTVVKRGDVVCTLDSSTLDDEEPAQQVRYLQAKAYVEQAKAIFEVNLITLKEYRDGIFPSDMQLCRQYIQTCQLEKDRLAANLEWSRAMKAKGFRTSSQVDGDTKAYERTVISLKEAEGMLVRLKDQTGPKIIKSLEANVKAIQSDQLTQVAAFELEKQRLERLKKNIENCTVKAPGDGIVVYVNTPDWSGRVQFPIDQGVALRQDQPIFHLPDPKNMRLRARINESKLSMIHTGLPAHIFIDAYPQRPLHGTVAEVNAINTPLNGSDVRIYYANVAIKEGFADLRPGLSAQVSFLVDARRSVVRVPIEAIRWAGETPFVALYDQSLAAANKDPWRWQPIEIGVSDTRFAEVLNGLKVGDRVVAATRGLPDPKPLPGNPPATSVADASSSTENRQ
jgi:HlyD family secretion protein